MNLNFSMSPQMVGKLLIETINNLTDSDKDRGFNNKQENFNLLTNLLSQISKENLTQIFTISEIREELLELSNDSVFSEPHYYEHKNPEIWKGDEIGHNLSRIFLSAISSENKNKEEFNKMIVYSLDTDNYSLFQQLIKQNEYDLDEPLKEHMEKSKWFLPEKSALLKAPLKMKHWEPILQKIKNSELAHNLLEHIVEKNCRFSSGDMASMAEEIIKLSSISNPEKFKIEDRFIETSFMGHGNSHIGKELHEYLQTLRDETNQFKAKIDFCFSELTTKNNATDNNIVNFLNQPEAEFKLNSEELLVVLSISKRGYDYHALSKNMLSALIKNKELPELMKSESKKEFLQKIFMLGLMDRTFESKEKRNFFMKKIYNEGVRDYTENLIYHINNDISSELKIEEKVKNTSDSYYFSLKPITEMLNFYKNNNIAINENEKISSLNPFFNDFYKSIQSKKGIKIVIAEKCYHFATILKTFEKDYENMSSQQLKNYFVILAEMGSSILFHNKMDTTAKKDFLILVEKEINELLEKYPNINFSFETTQNSDFSKSIKLLMNEKKISNSLGKPKINSTPVRF